MIKQIRWSNIIISKIVPPPKKFKLFTLQLHISSLWGGEWPWLLQGQAARAPPGNQPQVSWNRKAPRPNRHTWTTQIIKIIQSTQWEARGTATGWINHTQDRIEADWKGHTISSLGFTVFICLPSTASAFPTDNVLTRARVESLTREATIGVPGPVTHTWSETETTVHGPSCRLPVSLRNNHVILRQRVHQATMGVTSGGGIKSLWTLSAHVYLFNLEYLVPLIYLVSLVYLASCLLSLLWIFSAQVPHEY